MIEMTDPNKLIAQSKAICEAATPGPFTVVLEEATPEWFLSQLTTDQRDSMPPKKATVIGPDGGALYWGNGFSQADAKFFATARTLVPEMAAALSELQIQLSDVVCKKIEDMSEDELRSLCLLNGTTLEQTAAHTRYVIKTAPRQVDLENKVGELTRERDEARKRIADALKKSNGRFCEWGERAEMVEDILRGGDGEEPNG